MGLGGSKNYHLLNFVVQQIGTVVEYFTQTVSPPATLAGDTVVLVL